MNRLDDALSRPGRFDVRIAFYDATPEQAVSLFKHFYPLEDITAQPTEKSVNAQTELDELAKQFADGIFNSDFKLEVSMAALQGYLLQQKNELRLAAEGAEVWARGLFEDREEKVKMGQLRITGPPTPVSPVSESA